MHTSQGTRTLDPGPPTAYARIVRGVGRIASLNRTVILVVAILMLAVPASAFATAFYKGPVNGGVNNAGVEFRVKFKHGDPKKVLEFRWFNVPVPPMCADSFEGLKFEMKINDRHKFHGKYSVPKTDHVATVHGKLKHHGKKAVGTLELKGNFAGGCTDADTGPLPFKAKKAGG
jgi:hypothetical protein